MTSATSTRANKAKRDRQAEDLANERLVIEAMMRDVKGRRWVWNRLSGAHIFHEDMDFDPYHMAYVKGVRNEGLRLLNAVIQFSPELYIRMTQENTSLKMEESDAGPDTDDTN